jgi:cytochrome c551/c552
MLRDTRFAFALLLKFLILSKTVAFATGETVKKQHLFNNQQINNCHKIKTATVYPTASRATLKIFTLQNQNPQYLSAHALMSVALSLTNLGPKNKFDQSSKCSY